MLHKSTAHGIVYFIVNGEIHEFFENDIENIQRFLDIYENNPQANNSTISKPNASEKKKIRTEAQKSVNITSKDYYKFINNQDEILNVINERFDLFRDLIHNIISGVINSAIVYGAPGCGKSFNVEKTLKDRNSNYKIIKGKVSPSSLYTLLYEENGKILVFDDCDSILDDEDSLNILKAALDSNENRIINWNAKNATIQNEFEYTGRIIFITNKNLEKIALRYKECLNSGKVIPKNSEHISAIISRIDYLDLMLETKEEIFIRIMDIVYKTNIISRSKEDKENMLKYLWNNIDKLREISLRTILKLNNYYNNLNNDWERKANIYLLTKVIERGETA